MKTRFNTYDVACGVAGLQRCVGMRVTRVYDVDSKTYLFRLQRPDEKRVLLLESGVRFHSTSYEWPKSAAPSGFSMKLRKHLTNKRLESVTQLGVDRIVDFRFGSGEATYHVLLELYDRGNIVLTDCNDVVLCVLRPHTDGERAKFAAKEPYPLHCAKSVREQLDTCKLEAMFAAAKPGDTLKKMLNPRLEYGPALIDHALLKCSLAGSMQLVTDAADKGFYPERDLPRLEQALKLAEEIMETASKSVSKGYIVQKKEERPKSKDSLDGNKEYLLTNQEFHPFLYAQHENQPSKEFDTFDQAVDEFFSTLEGQKIDLKALHIEKEAIKKLHNVRKDHDKRLSDLTKQQKFDKEKADLITLNQELVDSAILAIQSAVANQLQWSEINALVKGAQENNDPVALSIKHLKLEKNHISLLLKDPYIASDSEDELSSHIKINPTVVDIDLNLSALGNARKYFDQKRSAAKKQQKTVESQGKALKSAEKKTIQTLKEVQTITTINKARKVYWFEKFYWFISSENYLIIGGRDQIQNEMLVKRYMRPTDIYVHADIAGASSIIIVNPSGNPVPPKTLNEAGQMAISYSIAWEAKVVTSAYWVNASQVSKSAPTGEYLTTGSFMIRGKKNFLPPSVLALGFTFMFKLEESSVFRHENERKVITTEESHLESEACLENANEDEEIILSDDEDDCDHSVTVEEVVKSTENLSIEQNKMDDTDTDEDNQKYPDTHIKVEHDTGKIIIHSTLRTLSTNSGDTEGENTENVIFLGDDKPVSFPSLENRRNKKSKKGESNKSNKDIDENVKSNSIKTNVSNVKRGQHGKLKKIKEKYKDQDEEDKAFFMEFLKPDGPKKELKKSSKKKIDKIVVKKPPIEKKPESTQSVHGKQDVSDDEEEQPKVNTDIDILCQLTGSPVIEDELLFAIPVIAPYSALQNYKYKVKLTPGLGKRGKAARTAVQIFLKDKNCNTREKDLLKAVKDENLVRNFPGKVKLSAPQMLKTKK